MEKVKLTREQAKAIEIALKESRKYKRNPDTLLRHVSMNNVNFHNELHPLNMIDIAVLAKALYIGYEVEPEFKVGDWVVSVKTGFVGTILDIFSDGMAHLSWGGSVTIKNLRHATPEEIAAEKERRWWAKHGREVWELKAGDVLLNRDNEFCEVTGKSDLNVFINDKPQQGSTVGSYGFKVVCFAEDRKDIGDN